MIPISRWHLRAVITIPSISIGHDDCDALDLGFLGAFAIPAGTVYENELYIPLLSFGEDFCCIYPCRIPPFSFRPSPAFFELESEGFEVPREVSRTKIEVFHSDTDLKQFLSVMEIVAFHRTDGLIIKRVDIRIGSRRIGVAISKSDDGGSSSDRHSGTDRKTTSALEPRRISARELELMTRLCIIVPPGSSWPCRAEHYGNGYAVTVRKRTYGQ